MKLAYFVWLVDCIVGVLFSPSKQRLLFDLGETSTGVGVFGRSRAGLGGICYRLGVCGD